VFALRQLLMQLPKLPPALLQMCSNCITVFMSFVKLSACRLQCQLLLLQLLMLMLHLPLRSQPSCLDVI
jgi:hypothetical protein